MELVFTWNEFGLGEDVKKAVESAISEVADSEHWDYRVCHPGPTIVHLALTGPLFSDLDGTVTCQCGVPAGKLSGKADASLLKFQSTPLG